MGHIDGKNHGIIIEDHLGTKNTIPENINIVDTIKDAKESKLIDNAAIFIAERDGMYDDISPDEERKLVRKVDRYLIPFLFITATLGAVDKVSLSTAAIYGFKEDNNLVGQQYSWLGSIIYFGSLAGMWPMSFAMQKFRLGKSLAIASLMWSSFTFLLCACHGFAGLAVIRFLMGFCECAIVPGCTLSCGRFYIKKEQGVRLSIIFAFASSVINGFLSWLVGYFSNSISKWRYLYIMVGSISFTWSLLMLYFLPDSPMNAKFLTDKEKYHVLKRVLKNSTGVETNDWKWDQAIEAFKDFKSYIIFLFNVGINIPNGGLSTFSSIIINNLGFDAMESSLMSMPTGVIATIATIFFTYLGGNIENRRCLLSVISLIFPLIGAALLYGVNRTNVAPQLVGLYLLYFYFSSYVIMMSLAQANTAGNTKKSVTYSINYYGYCVGAIIGPQTFRDNQAPKYTGGFIAMIAAYCACMLLAIIYWLFCNFENSKKRSALETDQESQTSEQDEVSVLMDTTDRMQKQFFYTT